MGFVLYESLRPPLITQRLRFQTLPINGPKRAGPGPFLLAFPGHAAPSYPLPTGFPGGCREGVGAARIPVLASVLPHFGAILGNPSGRGRALCDASSSPPLSEPGLASLINEGDDGSTSKVSSWLKGEPLPGPRLPEEGEVPGPPPTPAGSPRPTHTWPQPRHYTALWPGPPGAQVTRVCATSGGQQQAGEPAGPGITQKKKTKARQQPEPEPRCAGSRLSARTRSLPPPPPAHPRKLFCEPRPPILQPH